MLAAMMVVPTMDGIAKYLSAYIPVLQIVWARYFFHLLIMLPVVLTRYGLPSLLPKLIGWQILRAIFLLASTLLFFSALKEMPIADALAIIFVYPLVITAYSAFILKEAVGIRRTTAVILGFIGVLIIIRPGSGVFQWHSMLAVGAGLAYSGYLMITRKLSGSSPPLVTLMFGAIFGTLIMSATMPGVWVAPSSNQWLWMVGIGVGAVIGHFLIVKACEYASAAVLAPYGYTEIIGATLIGYLAFGDFPDAWTLTGIAVVIFSGIYISIRERKVKQKRI